MDKDCPKAPLAGSTVRPAARATTAPGPGKGKGKGKSKSKQFDGLCNKCRRWGHRAATCRVVMALEDNTESVNCMAEILSVEKMNGEAGVLS
eukprot:6369931-Heterocapsa_arctica.AAC.1